MEIYVKGLTAFTIKNCGSKVPKDIKFEKEDLNILDKYKDDNLSKIREKINNQDINFILNLLLTTF